MFWEKSYCHTHMAATVRFYVFVLCVSRSWPCFIALACQLDVNIKQPS